MKDLIDKILKYIPEYLMNFGKLLARPKTFLAKTRPQTKSGFQSGVQFLAVSLVLVVIAITTMTSEGLDIWKSLAANAVYELLAVTGLACVTRLAWLIVGGRAGTRSLFTLYSYIVSVSLVISALTLIMWNGTLRVFNPGVHAVVSQALLTHQSIPLQVATSKTYIAAAGVFLCGLLVGMAWFIATWGAFRTVNKSTRARSLVAFILANLLSLPILFVLVVIGRALGF